MFDAFQSPVDRYGFVAESIIFDALGIAGLVFIAFALASLIR